MKKVLMLIILVGMTFFITGCGNTEIEMTEEEKIKNILDGFIAGMDVEKEIEVTKSSKTGFFNAIIHYKEYDDSYDEIGFDAMYYINSVKKTKYSEKIDPVIDKYTIYFYKDHKLIYTAEYDNDGIEEDIKQINITNNVTNEKNIYTLEDKKRYSNYLTEKWAKQDADKQSAEEREKQEEEQKKSNSTVNHDVGETILCPEFEITLNKYEIKKEGTSISMLYVIDDPEWIGVTLTVKNISSEEKTFYNHYARLQNSNGEIIDPMYTDYDIWSSKALESPTLISQASKKGHIAFANNSKDNSNLFLLLNCGSYTTNDDIIFKYQLK